MWYPSSRKVRGLDGKEKKSRGLGYDSADDMTN